MPTARVGPRHRRAAERLAPRRRHGRVDVRRAVWDVYPVVQRRDDCGLGRFCHGGPGALRARRARIGAIQQPLCRGPRPGPNVQRLRRHGRCNAPALRRRVCLDRRRFRDAAKRRPTAPHHNRLLQGFRRNARGAARRPRLRRRAAPRLGLRRADRHARCSRRSIRTRPSPPRAAALAIVGLRQRHFRGLCGGRVGFGSHGCGGAVGPGPLWRGSGARCRRGLCERDCNAGDVHPPALHFGRGGSYGLRRFVSGNVQRGADRERFLGVCRKR
mmetsp:Transcript_14188/g.47366  ORF Transcript_14188/g.47366 Transcript_14188/m.47366 type:complete len:272 (+) Transcript_14188:4055-4870(+)